MKIYDVSMEIHPLMQVWKDRDERRPEFQVTRDYENGQGGRETRVSLDMHTGTHVDAPLHFIEDGLTIDHTSIERLVRNVKVLDLTSVKDRITREDLQHYDIESQDFVLFKTRNSYCDTTFDLNFVFLERTGAEYLVEQQIAGVGTDALGIERSQPQHETHISLLKRDIIIIEGLRLKDVPAGEYFMLAAPLRIVSVEAAPARVVLIDLT